MIETPRPIIDSIVRSACGVDVERLVRITSGGQNETYRAELVSGPPVVVRVARRSQPWFTDEAHIISRARDVGVPVPEVLGVEHLEHEGELLSFSVLELLPGRALSELADGLPRRELERLVLDSGELLARIHSMTTDRGVKHEPRPPEDDLVARAVETAHQSLGVEAAAIVRRGAEHLRELLAARGAPKVALAHGDFMPQHLLIDDGTIVGVIDWEFAGPASPAFDLARWELSPRNPLRDQTDQLRDGYARVADPAAASDGWIPAFAIDYSLVVLSRERPASPTRIRRCVEMITDLADPASR